jgi:glycosyltransferase involved in cell wall biosynthesis
MDAYPWGGSEELWSRAALRLRGQSHDVAISVKHISQDVARVVELKQSGAEVFVRSPMQGRLPIRIWRKVLLRRQRDFANVRRWGPDVVVVSQGSHMDGLEWMQFCYDEAIPHIAIVQCNHEAWWPRDDTAREMETLYSKAQKVFCVSKHNLRLLEYQIGAKLPNAAVVWNPHSVATDLIPPWPGSDRVWRFACVARLEPGSKGHDILFEVLSQERWRERAVELNLYGAGPWERGLRELAAQFGLTRVNFHGHVTDVQDIWRENHLLVLASRLEGMPLALVEAMWCARPAVVTDVGGNGEICVDGETGFVARAATPSLFDDALERAWQRRDDWKGVGEAARARVEKIIAKDPVRAFCDQLLEGVIAHKK